MAVLCGGRPPKCTCTVTLRLHFVTHKNGVCEPATPQVLFKILLLSSTAVQWTLHVYILPQIYKNLAGAQATTSCHPPLPPHSLCGGTGGWQENQEKCQFAKRTLSFLDHVIHADGVSPDPNKARDVVNMNTPTIITELRWFLGMVKQGEIHPIDCWTAQTTHRPAEQQVHLAMATQCQSFRGLRQPWHHPQSWHGMISQQILNFLQMLLLRLGAVLLQKADGSEFRPVV